MNRTLILVGALAVGSAALVGCNGATDRGELASVAGMTEGATAEAADADGTTNAGAEEYARWGRGHGGRGGHGRGGHGFRGHAGFGRGHRSWWRFW